MSEEKICLNISEKELKYLISCGIALIQNIQESSLPTYTGFTQSEILNFSLKLKDIADKKGIIL